MKTMTKKITLSSFIEQNVIENPNEVISTFKDEINVFTLEELNEKAGLLAKGFLYSGITKGTRVALVMAGTTNCLAFVLALAKVGATLIPFQKDMDILKIQKILLEEKVHSIGFYADVFLKKFNKIVPNISQNERGYLNTEKFPDLRNIITLGSVKNRGIFTTRELMLVGMHMDDFEMENSMVNVDPDDLFIKKVEIDDQKNMKITKITHRQILKKIYNFADLQQYLLNI